MRWISLFHSHSDDNLNNIPLDVSMYTYIMYSYSMQDKTLPTSRHSTIRHRFAMISFLPLEYDRSSSIVSVVDMWHSNYPIVILEFHFPDKIDGHIGCFYKEFDCTVDMYNIGKLMCTKRHVHNRFDILYFHRTDKYVDYYIPNSNYWVNESVSHPKRTLKNHLFENPSRWTYRFAL